MEYTARLLRKLVIAAALGTLLNPCCSFTVLAQPSLQYPMGEIKLGTVFNGSSKTVRVTLKNVGTEALRILNVRTSCGCTTIKTPKESLRPGESDVLDVSFDATGFRGRVTKYIHIETNDPEASFVSISMTADVSEELMPSGNSSFLWFGTIPIGKASERSFAYVNISNKAIVVKSASSSSPQISAKLRQTRIAPKDSVTFMVSVLPSQEGYASGDIVLHTDSKNQPRVPLRVTYVATRQ